MHGPHPPQPFSWAQLVTCFQRLQHTGAGGGAGRSADWSSDYTAPLSLSSERSSRPRVDWGVCQGGVEGYTDSDPDSPPPTK